MGWLTKTGQVYLWFAQFFILGILVAIVLGLLALWWTNGRRGVRSDAVALSIAIPFGCVAYGVVMMILRILLSGAAMASEPVNGDQELYPLPNGYVMSMSRDWTKGYISKGMSEHPDERLPHRYSVTAIEVQDGLVLGRSDLTEGSNQHYFLLDTKTDTLVEFADSRALRRAAAKYGVRLRLMPPHRYIQETKRYGMQWWMYPLLLVPMIMVLAGWVRRLWRMSRPIVAAA